MPNEFWSRNSLSSYVSIYEKKKNAALTIYARYYMHGLNKPAKPDAPIVRKKPRNKPVAKTPQS